MTINSKGERKPRGTKKTTDESSGKCTNTDREICMLCGDCVPAEQDSSGLQAEEATIF